MFVTVISVSAGGNPIYRQEIQIPGNWNRYTKSSWCSNIMTYLAVICSLNVWIVGLPFANTLPVTVLMVVQPASVSSVTSIVNPCALSPILFHCIEILQMSQKGNQGQHIDMFLFPLLPVLPSVWLYFRQKHYFQRIRRIHPYLKKRVQFCLMPHCSYSGCTSTVNHIRRSLEKLSVHINFTVCNCSAKTCA